MKHSGEVGDRGVRARRSLEAGDVWTSKEEVGGVLVDGVEGASGAAHGVVAWRKSRMRVFPYWKIQKTTQTLIRAKFSD